jgi:hypothetical protein
MEKVLDFQVFINAGTELEKKAVNYLLLVDNDIKTDYEHIRDDIANSTQQNMINFKLTDHKKLVVEFIFKINDRIKKYS